MTGEGEEGLLVPLSVCQCHFSPPPLERERECNCSHFTHFITNLDVSYPVVNLPFHIAKGRFSGPVKFRRACFLQLKPSHSVVGKVHLQLP